MTEERKVGDIKNIISSLKSSPFYLELHKSRLGSVLVVCGVLKVSEITSENICLISHGGRLNVRGSELKLSILENKTVEIFGRVEGVDLIYGKA